ncbi:MAG: PA2778 family cysteine peptidase [Desulforhopalus sp.]
MPAPLSLEKGLVLENTPYFPQQSYQCGPASLAMLLSASGVKTHPDALAPHTFLPGRKGSLQLELVAACRGYNRIPYVIDPDISSLVAELRAGRPVLVLQNLGLNILPAYHYAVVIGILPPDNIVLRSGDNPRLVMKMKKFLATWRRSSSWGMVALRPGELPTNPDPFRYIDAVSAFELMGDPLQAKIGYLAALRVWPDNQTALFGLGNNYLRQAQYLEAVGVFRSLIKKNPSHIAAINNLADTLVRLDCYSQASTTIDQAILIADRINSPLKDTVLQTRNEITKHLQQTGLPSTGNCRTRP